jgi:intracellular sulfur oxidation DsrE/DsrF family protein
LGELLMANYLRLLSERTQLPKAVCLVNSAVYLATDGHPGAEHLRRLSEAGTEVLSCRTCLEYFDVVHRLVVGRIASMGEILGIMLACERTLVL